MKKTIVLIMLAFLALAGCKRVAPPTMEINARDTDTVVVYFVKGTAQDHSAFIVMDTLGNAEVRNDSGVVLWKGNIHKSPCKKCYKGGSMCSRWKRMYDNLYKKYESCEKGNYYAPPMVHVHHDTVREIPVDTLPTYK